MSGLSRWQDFNNVFPSYTQGVCLRLWMQSSCRVHKYYDTSDRHDTFSLSKWYSFHQTQEIIKLTLAIQNNLMKTLTGLASWSQPSQNRSSDSETADQLQTYGLARAAISTVVFPHTCMSIFPTCSFWKGSCQKPSPIWKQRVEWVAYSHLFVRGVFFSGMP